MRVLRYVVCLFIVIVLAGCFCGGFKQVKTSEGMLACPECCPMIKYSGTSISVKGVNLPIPNAPVSIGEVTVEPKVIQQACEAVQILEQHRIAACQMLPSYATVSKASFAKALEAMQNDETALTQFALIVSTKDGAAIQKFVEFYFSRAQHLKVAAAQPSDKGYKLAGVDILAESSAEHEELSVLTVASLRELLK